MNLEQDLLPATAALDRELELGELLEALDGRLVTRLLEDMLPEGGLVGMDGHLVAGMLPAADAVRVPVRHELLPVAELVCPHPDQARATALAGILESLLRMAARHLMASDLHLRAVREDYLALRERNAALEASEARFRALAGELEQRVQAQVATIEARQRQLFQAEKLASVGRLAAGMAHEINNPIGFIASNLRTGQAYLEELRAAGAAGGELYEDFAALLTECQDGAGRIAAIVRDLKVFANVDGAELSSVDLQELLENTRRMAAALIDDAVTIELEGGPPARLRLRRAELAQALLNILVNAGQALPGGGTVHMAARSVPGGYEVEVTDPGMGMDAAVLSQVFDPFFTTHPPGRGCGLGLTVARAVVQAHGGRIDLDSAPGRGTRVSIFLPATGVEA